jgi:hypothetical protein
MQAPIHDSKLRLEFQRLAAVHMREQISIFGMFNLRKAGWWNVSLSRKRCFATRRPLNSPTGFFSLKQRPERVAFTG